MHSGGRRLLFACDTGYYSEDTWEFLQGKSADTVVMEATFCTMTDRGGIGDMHLNFDSFHKQLEKMSAIGFIDKDTGIYATHISCAIGKSYDEMQSILDGYGWGTRLAHDGLAFPF